MLKPLAIFALPVLIALSNPAAALFLAACADTNLGESTPCDQSTVDTLVVAVEGGTFGLSSEHAAASAVATESGQVGALKAQVSVSTGFPGAALVEAGAVAEWSDILRFESPIQPIFEVFGVLVGTFLANIEFTVEVGGDLSASGFDAWQSEASMDAFVRSHGLQVEHHAETDSVLGLIGNEDATLTLTQTQWEWTFDPAKNVWFTNIGLRTTLHVRTDAGNFSCLSGMGTCTRPGSTAGSADYSNTMALTGVRVINPLNGSELFGFDIFGQTGIDYGAALRETPGGGDVPEPPVLALMLLAFLGAAIARVRHGATTARRIS